jgi:hypothetical protein
MGRELIPVESAPSGRICGIEFDSGWLNASLLCSEQLDFDDNSILDFDAHQRSAEPLVRV